MQEIPRRRFLKGSAAAAMFPKIGRVGQADAGQAAPNLPSGERVRFAMVGIGMQGSGLLATSIRLPGVECVAAADLYDARHTLAQQITGNASLPTTRRYRELLDRKDVDCVVAAVPDHWHMRVVVDACNAGKDIYCEKPMSHTIAQGFAMADAARKGNRIVQIGSQRVSSALCAKANELYQQGAIGEIEVVELSMGRNSPTGAWIYPPPPGASPENLDWDTWLNDAPKIPFDAKRFARWRCWREYGTGVGGDLMVHLVSGMMRTLGWNKPPRSAASVGGIFRWKDGRNMPDTHSVLFDYDGIPVYVRLNLAGESPELARFIGPKGVIETTGDSIKLYSQTGQDDSPSYYSSSFPEPMRSEYFKEWYAHHYVEPGHEPVTASSIWHGDDWDDEKPHLWNFFRAVKSRQPVIEDAVFGNHAAIACHMANESYFQKKTLYFDESARGLHA